MVEIVGGRNRSSLIVSCINGVFSLRQNFFLVFLIFRLVILSCLGFALFLEKKHNIVWILPSTVDYSIDKHSGFCF